MFDGKAFGIEVVAVVKAHVEKTVAPLLSQIDALRKEIDLLKSAPAPKAGKDADQEVVSQIVADVKSLRQDVDALNPQIEAIGGAIGEEIAEHVGKALAEIPGPVTFDQIKQMMADAIAALPPAEKGKDADPVDAAAQIAAEVERAVAALPAPQDGKSVTLEDMRPLIDEAVTKAVTLIPIPKDGVDGKDGRDGLDVVKFIRDDRGHLNGILRDGTTVDLGEYVGKDGAPGERGKDGLDGVGFDDLDLVIDEEGVMIKFVKGENVKSFRIPVPIDRGVFKEGTEYRKGDGVSFGGSWFIAQEDTSEKPENGKGWRLAVKRGRDGRDGELKAPRETKPVKVG